MTGDASRANAASGPDATEAGWLESGSGRIFAFYHPPQGVKRDFAVLLCDPLGPDRMNLHLAYRALAKRFAAAGFAALRFDPVGTGDASGSPRDADWPSGWQGDAARAAAWLLARSGASRLAVFGARFGGTLAATLSEADAVMLWGPYPNGRTFLRNEKALARLKFRGEADGVGSGAASEGARALGGALLDTEYQGFVYRSSAMEVIRGIRPFEVTRGRRERAQLIAWDEDEDEVETDLAGHFRSLGIETEVEHLPGLVSDRSLTEQAVPEILIDRCVDWLEGVERAVPRTEKGQGACRPGVGALEACARVERGEGHEGEVEESVVRFGDGDSLFGIVSAPVKPTGTRRRPGLVFVNGGNNHRVGINRNGTEWTREAALAGVTSLRFDVRGLGDSEPRRPEDLNVLYRDETQADVLEATRFMDAREDCDGVVLAGLCAGAYQAFHAARRDPRVRGLVLFDLLRWDPNAPTVWAPSALDRRRRSLNRWRRRLVGDLGFRPSILSQGIAELTGRGTDVLLVSCADSGGLAHVEDGLGGLRKRFEATGRFRLEALENCDHIFTPLWAQAWLSRRLARYLEDFTRRSC